MSPTTPSRRLDWYWHRLRAMGPTEIAARILERARLSTDRSAARVLNDFDLDCPTEPWPRLPRRNEAPDRVRAMVREEATAIREGRWVLFAWNPVQVPDPPIWHRDYCNGTEAPAGIEAWRMNHRQLETSADARYIWEANRWAEMVRLAQNAWLNGVLDDATLAQRWLLDWCDKNPLGMGINWCSALEAGVRLVNFCWIDALVRGCDSAELTLAETELARRIVPNHAWWLWRHLSFGSSANNHLLGELSGLVLATRRWPSLARVACTPDQAWQLESAEILRQFAEDGGNREQALHYHQFAWELVWQAERVMGGEHGPVSQRLREAAKFFSDLVHDQESWDFGDSDDAQVTPLTFARRTAASEWRAWLLAEEHGAAVRFWLGAPPQDVSPLKEGVWKDYPVSGLAVQVVDGWRARVDGSPLGFGRLAAHGHLDAMHVSLWVGDRALVVDPGTGTYSRDPGVRSKLASWEWHNGPLPLTGRSRPLRLGPFLWAAHHDTPQLAVEGEVCTVRCKLEGFLTSRTVEYRADKNAWQVTDDIEVERPHVVRWRLAPQWRVMSQAALQVTVTHATGSTVTLAVASEEILGLEVTEDLVSPHFGDLRQGLVISVAFRRRLVSEWHRVEPAT